MFDAYCVGLFHGRLSFFSSYRLCHDLTVRLVRPVRWLLLRFGPACCPIIVELKNGRRDDMSSASSNLDPREEGKKKREKKKKTEEKYLSNVGRKKTRGPGSIKSGRTEFSGRFLFLLGSLSNPISGKSRCLRQSDEWISVSFIIIIQPVEMIINISLAAAAACYQYL